MELEKIIERLAKKMEGDKTRLSDLKAEKKSIQTRAGELSAEIMTIMGTGNLKDAFTKFYQLTELETRLEKSMMQALECYNTGNFKDMLTINSNIAEISAKIQEIKNGTTLDGDEVIGISQSEEDALLGDKKPADESSDSEEKAPEKVEEIIPDTSKKVETGSDIGSDNSDVGAGDEDLID